MEFECPAFVTNRTDVSCIGTFDFPTTMVPVTKVFLSLVLMYLIGAILFYLIKKDAKRGVNE